MPAPLTDPGQLAELLGIPFTPEQTACITAPPAPQVIVAGAGSGKTTVMAARVVWLVGTGQVAPDRVLGLTFTNKAAGELADRVRKALHRAGVTDPDPDPAAAAGSGEAAGEPQISTYHAFAGQLLSEHGLRLGIEPTVALLADATRFQLAAGVLRTAQGPFDDLTKSVPALVEDLLALDAELSEHLVDPEAARSHGEELLASLDGAELTNDKLRRVPQATRARQELLGLVEAYRARKREGERIDFGDQIALAARLARIPDVGRALREQFSVVLLDEYQDTSVAQRVLLAGLFGQGTGHPVTAVGDPCQAIYGWRGASVANLDEFPRHFPHADGSPACRQSLSENRRSGGRLLTLANGLAAPLRERHAGVEALRPAPDAAQAGRVRAALLETQEQETDWLADSLAHLVRTGTPPGEIAVLCRGAGDFARIQRALTERELPVEVVGLSGLLHLPEIADLVAVCEVLQDPTANASLVRLLTGPRWRIGPRDLALLGRRAALLVAHQRAGTDDDPDQRLAAAVEGADPTELRSLADALDTFLDGDGPDDALPFSAEARIRFARLAAELRDLRRSLADPLMDVLHRVLTVTGLDVELAASPQAVAARRRETLGRFLDIAAGFASVDGETSLLAFLAFLRTAVQHEKGLDSSLPGGENTVKLLTAHKSKGLEWDVVAVPGLVAKQFPSEQARETWTTQPKVLPYALRGDAATLPPAPAWSAKGLKEHDKALRVHQATEELRLGYVTFTRPRSLLLGSGHWWGPAQKRPRGPSAFLEALRAHCEAGPANGEVEHWADPPEEGTTNPALEEPAEERAWPLPLDATALERRRDAARTVLSHLEAPWDRAASVDRAPATAGGTGAAGGPSDEDTDRDRAGSAGHTGEEGLAEGGAESAGDLLEEGTDRAGTGGAGGSVVEEGALAGAPPDGPVEPAGAAELTPEEARLVDAWDRDLGALTDELRRSRAAVRDVPLPGTLSATELLRMAADPEGFARELARPMPRPPRPAAARRGTRFHAWVESRFEELTLPMLGPDELPGADGEGPDGSEPPAIADERDLAALKEAFERTPYARRTPYRVEAPFQLVLAGRVIRGRIDAVYRDRTADGGVRFDIVDWKTGRTQDADPLQLAVYRLAWAEQRGVPLSSVGAAFLYVRSGDLVRPTGLPGRAELEGLLTGAAGSPATQVPGSRPAAEEPPGDR